MINSQSGRRAQIIQRCAEKHPQNSEPAKGGLQGSDTIINSQANIQDECLKQQVKKIHFEMYVLS